MRGITSFGAYVPRRRLPRAAIAAAHAWANPGLKALAKGRRAFGGPDEDSLTMAVEAARRALAGGGPAPAGVLFASTTAPFADRQNATLIGEALGLPETLHTADFGGGLRAGVAALRQALEGRGDTLVTAADRRAARPGSSAELRLGDGAAAIMVGTGAVLAELVAAHARSVDFVDHYRAAGARFDYHLEERWVREEGQLAIVPPAVRTLLEEARIAPGAVARFICGGLPAADGRAIAATCGIAAEAVAADRHEACGDSGAAHPLLLLTDALQAAAPGDLILLAGVGQGVELLLLRAGAGVAAARDRIAAEQALQGGIEDDNYLRFLAYNDLIEMDWGMRAERDLRTAQSAFWRHRHTVTGLIGGRCTQCGTPQFPRARMCVNPDCRAVDTQVPEPFADKAATVKSFTEDWLGYCTNPPLLYGNIRFAGGGVAMLEFTDFAPGQLAVGTPLQMQFRVKDFDAKRGFRRYCWKAAPAAVPAPIAAEGQDNG
jgi:3-hydroxy-3-methylglutaryl CoA synthase